MNRPEISQGNINEAIKRVVNTIKLELAIKGPHTFSSKHEILGILTEEYYELVKAVHTDVNFQGELIDVAVAAVYGLACSLQEGALDW